MTQTDPGTSLTPLLDEHPQNREHRGRLAPWMRRAGTWFWTVSDRVFFAVVIAVAIALRLPRLWIRYWGDEAISIGIASRPLHQIPAYLHFDGSPPLYYVLLHYWMALFGTSEAATHTLSLIISLLIVPAAWWCARHLAGERAARPAAVLAAVFPFLVYYGTETRMYVLVGLFSMVAVTAWVRALQAPRTDWRWLGLAALASVAVLYTHNWGLFLVVACALVGLAAAWRARDRVLLWRTLGYGGAVVLAYLPWVPSFWWQLHATGAPWAPRPGVIDFFVDPLYIAFSEGSAPTFAVIIAFVVAPGALALLVLARRRRLRPSPSVRAGGAGWLARSPLVAAGTIAVVTVALGWGAGQVVHSWAPRYLAVALVPGLLVVAAVFAASAPGRRFFAVAVVAMTITSVPALIQPGKATYTKSNVAAVDAAVASQMGPGDVVITTAVSELPVIAWYLPKGLRYATPTGLVADPRIVDWRDLSARLTAADPTTALRKVLASVPVGGHVLLVDPLSWASTQTPPSYAGIVAADGIAVNVDILQDPAYTVVQTERPAHPGAIANSVEGVLFRKVG